MRRETLDAWFRDKRFLVLWLVVFLTLCLLGGLFEAETLEDSGLPFPRPRSGSHF